MATTMMALGGNKHGPPATLVFAAATLLLCAQAAVAARSFSAAAAFSAADSVPSSLLVYNLSYTDTTLSRADAFEHTLVVAALSGLANRDSPRIFTPYMPADDQWQKVLTQSGKWLSNTTFVPIPSGGDALLPLVRAVRQSWAGGSSAIRGLVLYDPQVPATSNVASTAAGVEGLLPVCKRNASAGDVFPTAYEQLVDELPVVLDLTAQGFRGGPRTGSAKADAYLWAIERYITPNTSDAHQQLADPTLLAYFVDYFGATQTPPPPPHPLPPPPTGSDHMTQGQALPPGESLVAVNKEYHLEMQTDGNLVLYKGYGPSQSVLWATASSSPNGGTLELSESGELFVSDAVTGKKLWSSNSGSSSPGKYWVWMQHDGDLVIYAGVCCQGTVVWSSNTTQPTEKQTLLANFSGGTPFTLRDTDYVQTKTTNHDYFVSQRGFFFDLSVWADEAPNDEPWQPIGSDKQTLLSMLKAVQSAATAANHGEAQMIHMGGFTPWHFKYVKDGMCGSACKHAGVETEWATMLILSGFNVFADADACCTVGTMANSALWAHHPLPDVLHQKFTPLTLPELQARGYVQSDGKTVVPKAYACYYAGDYDSAAWVYNKLLGLFDDGSGARGKTPIGWAVDPELSLRFPPIFPLLYALAEPTDVFISGDSGAGYLNPSVLPDKGLAWKKWNTAWFGKFDLNFTGFVINGDAGTMTTEAESIYAAFSPAGIVYTPNIDPRGPNNTGGVTAEGVPVLHHIQDLPIGISMPDALKSVTEFAATQAQAPNVPQFAVFRTILQPASFHGDVATQSAAAAANLAWVDPVTAGMLVKLHAQQQLDE